MSKIEILPNEILQLIISYINYDDLISVSSMNSMFRHLIKYPILKSSFKNIINIKTVRLLQPTFNLLQLPPNYLHLLFIESINANIPSWHKRELINTLKKGLL